ncbi:heavy metal translocatin [Melanomma pulvis-pyrius CBS 109.77]|uniref:Heavy metal translocatin n=1 Tax=Melanomma pulvis-pyrius CBS 109.77 TaxID=1314802 RepID=A0A6A6XR69_9PLEO|nr:heavy metal translocatin [Melanomma pulvis-pyrius CBS 109.77]
MAGGSCCASKGCCGGSREGKELPEAVDKQDVLPPPTTNLDDTTPPSQTSINIAASNSMTDVGAQESPANTCMPPGSKRSDSSLELSTTQSHSSRTCCSRTPILSHEAPEGPHVHSKDIRDDGERGPPTFERIILTIEGLKCGCCESGIAKTIQNVRGIQNHQVNVVLARVEFDLDTCQHSISEVIVRLNRATGYTFKEYVQPDGQILELLVSDPSSLYQACRPDGVTLLNSGTKQHIWSPARLLSGRSSVVPPEVSGHRRPPQKIESGHMKSTGPSLYQHTIRAHYDAAKIGARDVFEYYQQLAPGQHIQLAPLSAHPSLAIGAKQTKRACLVFLITLTFTIPVLVFAWAQIDHENLVYDHISLALATVVQIIATKEFVPGALRSLVHSGLFEMDFLVALSTSIAYVFSVISYAFRLRNHPLETGSFFETSTLLVTLILLGRVVGEFARFRAAKSVSFRSLQAEEALLVISGGLAGPGNETHKIDARLLQYGDSFKVPPHTRIVTDGRVTYGGSEVDEAMITGESIPVAKGLGHMVYAGTTNGDGQLIVALTKLPHENSISKIATMIENAELSKPKVQALADTIAGWFVPAIAAVGISVFLIWLFVDRYINHRTWQNSVVTAITYAIATLIVSCPCAIGLAVPMVVLIAGGVSARFGIIFRDPQKLEVARNVTDLVLDKTGTLTTGEMEVVEGNFHGTYPEQIKSLTVGLLEDVKHPVAAAVFKWLQKEPRHDVKGPIVPTKMVNISSIPGEGVVGTCNDSRLEVRAGNPQWLGVHVMESEHTLLCVSVSGVLSATFRLQDRARHSAEKVVKLLGDRGIAVHMISGDSEGAVKEIAHTLNIPKSHTRCRLRPGDKQKYIQDLQNNGKIVMFVGDGTNDSVALKQADVGVHMNHGSDVAKSASDVVLMTTRLHDILILLDISKAAYRRIITNFAWSAIYNMVAILMAAGAFVQVRIEPAYAGLGELVSVVPIFLIAFQMKWRDYGKSYRAMEYE